MHKNSQKLQRNFFLNFKNYDLCMISKYSIIENWNHRFVGIHLKNFQKRIQKLQFKNLSQLKNLFCLPQRYFLWYNKYLFSFNLYKNIQTIQKKYIYLWLIVYIQKSIKKISSKKNKTYFRCFSLHFGNYSLEIIASYKWTFTFRVAIGDITKFSKSL